MHAETIATDENYCIASYQETTYSSNQWCTGMAQALSVLNQLSAVKAKLVRFHL